MHKQLFVNLAVQDLERSKAFYSALGYGFDPRFGNEHGACVVVAEDNLYVMLLKKDFFATLTPKAPVDAHQGIGALLCLSCESQQEADDLVAKAIAAGGRQPHEPEDYGFMYSTGFEDPDGHGWGLAVMRGTPG